MKAKAPKKTTKAASKTKPAPAAKPKVAAKPKAAAKAKPVVKTKPVAKAKPVAKTKAVVKTKAVAPTKAGAKGKAVAKTKAAAGVKPSEKLLKLLAQALDGKKAENLRVLDVSQQSSITDYLVLATGNSDPHLRALRIELERVLDDQKAKILGVDTSKGSGWTVVDAFEVMVHLFTPENRDKYRMELLWKDATDVPLAKLLK